MSPNSESQVGQEFRIPGANQLEEDVGGGGGVGPGRMLD